MKNMEMKKKKTDKTDGSDNDKDKDKNKKNDYGEVGMKVDIDEKDGLDYDVSPPRVRKRLVGSETTVGSEFGHESYRGSPSNGNIFDNLRNYLFGAPEEKEEETDVAFAKKMDELWSDIGLDTPPLINLNDTPPAPSIPQYQNVDINWMAVDIGDTEIDTTGANNDPRCQNLDAIEVVEEEEEEEPNIFNNLKNYLNS